MTRAAAPPALRLGSTLLALSSLGMLAAPVAILSARPDLATRAGRHALAGAFALTALAALELLLALIPIRRGEPWALLAAAIPFVIVGVPILVVDATHVAPVRLWNTLAPQVAGLVVGVSSLLLCAVSAARMHRSPPR
jgi:hypothetical protein